MFNTTRFGHKFTDDVANPNEMILFKKQRKEIKKNDTSIDKEAMNAVFAGEDVSFCSLFPVKNIFSRDICQQWNIYYDVNGL